MLYEVITLKYLTEHIARQHIELSESLECHVFTNHSNEMLSRSGVKYILDKYVTAGRANSPLLFSDKITPHTLRHSKAMHMLQAGNNIVYIRDILGHSDLNTTERYARADTSMKREALSKAEMPMPEIDVPITRITSYNVCYTKLLRASQPYHPQCCFP